MIKKIFIAIVAMTGAGAAQAQLTVPANGTSVQAKVSERIGLTDVSVEYGRPAVKGREGKIWGDLVHTGFKNQGFGSGNDAPWRAGANENTVIEFSTDVTIEGKKLPAGRYGFFVAYQPDMSTVIFSKATTSWGSYFYDAAEDVLRVQVKPVKLGESRERLTFQFGNETDSSAVISLEWEKLAIPFKVSTALHQLQMASFEREMKGERGFDPHAQVQLAEYLLEHNTQLDLALTNINRAAQSMPVFAVFQVKADILRKMNKAAEADEVMKVAVEGATEREMHNYARGLLRDGNKQAAYDAFKQNYKKHPDTYTTCAGMARGCSAMGKTKDALKYANKTVALAPDAGAKKAAEEMVATLNSGKAL